jgi:aspartate racemase
MSKTLHILELFALQVNRYPEKTALKSASLSLTYRELDRISNQWANYILSRKAGGKCIGITLNRSAAIPQIILGVLKAGSVYVFIDPRYPEERKRYIMEDSGITMLITSHNTDRIDSDLPIIYIDDNPLQGIASDTPRVETDGESLAYIMYTSGSTGRPKGVELTAGNIHCYITAVSQVINPVPEDIHLHTASFSFSSSVRQYFVPLANGGTLVIADEDQVKSLPALLALIKAEKVTMVDSTPSLWKYGFVQIEGLPVTERDALVHTSIRHIVFSGDMLPAQLISKIRQTLVPVPAMANICGQTETIGGFGFAIPADHQQDTGTIPIGYPLPGYTFLALDENQRPVKPGEIGELYISSGSVGRGYHHNPELTERIFHPAGHFEGTPHRTARIGDLIRFNTDRPVELMGRADFQIKIRAVRIDPAEIETVACEMSFVREATVVPYVNSAGETAIAAFVLPKPDMQIDVNLVRNHFKAKLPETYQPEKVIPLVKYPLNPNGKIDRKALQAMAVSQVSDAGTRAPATFANEIEKSLYNLFSRVLDIKDFGLEESFFDLGGHSLRAVELTDIMETLYNKKVPMDLVYRYSSVAALAARIESLEENDMHANLIPFKPDGKGIPFVCVHGDDANFFIPKYLDVETPFYGYFHQGRNGEKMAATAIEDIAFRYVDELMKVRPVGPYILGGYSIGGVIAQAMIPLIRKQGQDVRLLVLIDTESPDYSGSRTKGRQVFGNAEPFSHQNRNGGNNNTGFLGRASEFLRAKWFNYSYFIGASLSPFGIRVPLQLRNPYIMGTYRRAREMYHPGMSAVDTVLFRATMNNLDSHDLGWKRFLNGDLKILELDTDHNNIIKEPFIGYLSRELTGIIQSLNG